MKSCTSIQRGFWGWTYNKFGVIGDEFAGDDGESGSTDFVANNARSDENDDPENVQHETHNTARRIQHYQKGQPPISPLRSGLALHIYHHGSNPPVGFPVHDFLQRSIACKNDFHHRCGNYRKNQLTEAHFKEIQNIDDIHELRKIIFEHLSAEMGGASEGAGAGLEHDRNPDCNHHNEKLRDFNNTKINYRKVISIDEN